MCNLPTSPLFNNLAAYIRQSKIRLDWCLLKNTQFYWATLVYECVVLGFQPMCKHYMFSISQWPNVSRFLGMLIAYTDRQTNVSRYRMLITWIYRKTNNLSRYFGLEQTMWNWEKLFDRTDWYKIVWLHNTSFALPDHANICLNPGCYWSKECSETKIEQPTFRGLHIHVVMFLGQIPIDRCIWGIKWNKAYSVQLQDLTKDSSVWLTTYVQRKNRLLWLKPSA